VFQALVLSGSVCTPLPLLCGPNRNHLKGGRLFFKNEKLSCSSNGSSTWNYLSMLCFFFTLNLSRLNIYELNLYLSWISGLTSFLFKFKFVSFISFSPNPCASSSSTPSIPVLCWSEYFLLSRFVFIYCSLVCSSILFLCFDINHFLNRPVLLMFFKLSMHVLSQWSIFLDKTLFLKLWQKM